MNIGSDKVQLQALEDDRFYQHHLTRARAYVQKWNHYELLNPNGFWITDYTRELVFYSVHDESTAKYNYTGSSEKLMSQLIAALRENTQAA